MSALFKNNATALLAASISTSGTTLVLAAGSGIKFPVLTGPDFFYGTIYDSAGNYEIVKVTARVADSLTVVRAQEGTTALAFSSGDAFAQRVTAASLNDFAQKSVDQTFTGVNTFNGVTDFNGHVTGATADFSGAITSVNPTFTGTVTVPTQTAGDNTTKAASTSFVTTAVTGLSSSLGTIASQNANAVSITGGSVSGITDLAVADGGTGVSALTANAVVIGNGTSPVTTLSPGSSNNIMLSNGSNWTSTPVTSVVPVVGQTWTSFNSSERGASIDYTNTTGKTIQVLATFGCNGGGSGSIYVNGQRLGLWAAQFNGCGGYSLTPQALVPPGATYRAENMGGGFVSWWELR